MKPENILQSDLLDILFENRNKTYGAYYIRRHYQNYLLRAMLMALGGAAVILFFFRSIPEKDKLRSFTIPAIQPLHPIVPVDLEPPPPPAPRAMANVATQKATVYRIVNTAESIDDPVPDVQDLANGKISLVTMSGAPGDIEPPVENKGSAPAANTEKKAPISAGPYNNSTVDKSAEFPGGLKAMMRFLQRTLHNPEKDMTQAVKVRIRFIVDESGNVGDFNIIESGGEMIDREVITALKKMPRWKPAIKNGRQVAVYFVQPVTFDTVSE